MSGHLQGATLHIFIPKKDVFRYQKIYLRNLSHLNKYRLLIVMSGHLHGIIPLRDVFRYEKTDLWNLFHLIKHLLLIVKSGHLQGVTLYYCISKKDVFRYQKIDLWILTHLIKHRLLIVMSGHLQGVWWPWEYSSSHLFVPLITFRWPGEKTDNLNVNAMATRILGYLVFFSPFGQPYCVIIHMLRCRHN